MNDTIHLGIDFGTCFTSAAFLNDEILTTVKDPLTGLSSFPSTVLYTREGKMLVGNHAIYQSQRHPDRFRSELKRVLGQNTPILLGDTSFSVVDLIAAIIEKIKNEANSIAQGMGKPLFSEAIFTIPAVYQGYLQKQVENFANRAGFLRDKVKLLTEPVAAAYYYASKNVIQSGEILLVYDLGGGTFDTALLKKTGETFEYLTTPSGFLDHGGLDFDRAIYLDLLNKHSVLGKLLKDNLTDIITMQVQSILSDMCIKLKHQLSELDEAWLTYVVPGSGELLEYTLQRTDFEAMIAPIVQDTITCCQRMIIQADVKLAQISHILLVGGSCRIPLISQTLQRTFNCSIITAPDLELVVCQGAAVYGKMLNISAKKQPQVTLKRTRPLSRPYYTTANRPRSLDHVKVAVLGASSSGRASMMRAMYGMMCEGIGDFTLNAPESEVDLNLIDGWDQLVEYPGDYGRWPLPTCRTTVYTFDFCYKQQGLINFDWLESRGGILEYDDGSESEEKKWMVQYLNQSSCILICIPGDLLTTSIRGREASVRYRAAIDGINSFLAQSFLNSLNTPVAVVITKSDLIVGKRDTDDVISEIKTLFSSFFVPGGGWSVMICPVSLGLDLCNNELKGEINPMNIHLPLAFFAHSVLSHEIERLEKSQAVYSRSSYIEMKTQQVIIKRQLLLGKFNFYYNGSEADI